jgi:hypothetical protein
VLARPGIYCISEDLVFKGATSDAAALLVRADDVQVWFLGRTLSNATAVVPDLATGILVEGGLHRVGISGGRLQDFYSSIKATKIVDLSVRQMSFASEGTGSGIDADDVVNAVFETNTFERNVFAISVRGPSPGTVIRDNTIRISIPSYVGFQYGITLQWTQGVWVVDNRITGDAALGYPVLQNTGIWVWHCSYRDASSVCGRGNLVENNVLTGLQQGIFVNGSGQGQDNVVRGNRIYGSYPSYRPRRPYSGPWDPRNRAIVVQNEARLVIDGNLIVSGPTRHYERGISVYQDTGRTMSMARQPNGRPALSRNETCGTRTPLTLPTGANPTDFDDGSNRWEWCFSRVPPAPPVPQ